MIISLISIILKSTEKSYMYQYNLFLIILLTRKSLEMFPKHYGYCFISEALNWSIFVALNKKTVD